MKQHKYTDRYGNVYYEVTFTSQESVFFFHQDNPATTHTAKVAELSGQLYRVEEVDGKFATSRVYCTIRTAIKHCWLSIK